MNTSLEERNEIAFLSFKHLLNQFPIIGPFLTEIFFEFRGKVKQQRINDFVSKLEIEFAKLDIDPQKMQTEENLDLFESIIKKVSETRSEQKRIGFKNILMHGVKDIQTIEYCEIFSGLLINLNQKELQILTEHKDYLISGNSILKTRNDLNNELKEIQNVLKMQGPFLPGIIMPHRLEADVIRERENAEKVLLEYKMECTAEKFNISKDEYRYFLQDLFSKGLLFDDGVGSIGTRAFEIMSITQFGSKFLEFIRI